MRPSVAAGLLVWTLVSVPTSIVAGTFLAWGQARSAARRTHPAAIASRRPEPAAA
jgi:hypothetical protein